MWGLVITHRLVDKLSHQCPEQTHAVVVVVTSYWALLITIASSYLQIENIILKIKISRVNSNCCCLTVNCVLLLLRLLLVVRN